MAFDAGEDDDDRSDDCPICDGLGIISTGIPALALLRPGAWVGEIYHKRRCPICWPGAGCTICSGLSGPGFVAKHLCRGAVTGTIYGTLSCPICDAEEAEHR